MRLCLTLLLAVFASALQAQTVPPASASEPASLPSPAQIASQPTDSPAKHISAPTAPPTTKHESWTELPLDKSGLPSSIFNAILLGKYDEPTYTRELVRVEWRQGDPIELNIVVPKGTEKGPAAGSENGPAAKVPVILYLYDYTADGTRFQNDGWCKRATKDGFAAVGFVSALSGQRFHSPRPMRQWFVSEMPEALASSTHDVQLILNYLATRNDLDVNRVGMIAQGSGGAVAVLAASVDPRIAAIDLINPWGDWPDWLKGSEQIPAAERASYLSPEFLAKVSPLDPVKYLPNMKGKAIRIEQLMDDTVTPAAARDKIEASVPSPADQVVRFANVAAHQSAWQSTGLTEWVREQLRPAPTSSSQQAGNATH